MWITSLYFKSRNVLQYKNMRKGFSLIEILVAVGIIAVVSLVVLPSFLGTSHQTVLNSAAQQIVSAVRESQSRSVSQTRGAQWGIHFDNSTNTAPFYAIFTGSSYGSGTTESHYQLPATIAFACSTLAPGSSMDVTFSPISGLASTPATIGIYAVSQPSLSSTITIAPTGVVFAGMSAPPTCTGPCSSAPSTSVYMNMASKSCPRNARAWVFTLYATASGTAYNARVSNLVFRQSFGTPCTPTIISPMPAMAIPANIPPGGTGTSTVVIDFSSCYLSSRFTVTITPSADNAPPFDQPRYNQFP